MTDNRDLNRRFEKLEKRLDAVVVSSPLSVSQKLHSRADEIDLGKLFFLLWQSKWWIIGGTFLFALAGVFLALSLPDRYESKGIYAPSQKQSGNPLTGQLGGLASLAGVSLGSSESNDIEQAVTLTTSWPFLEKFIEKNNLKPLLMGVNGWNRETGELKWDEKVYDPVTNKWFREPTQYRQAEPSSYETYLAFKELLEVNYDLKVNMITVTIEHFSPVVAQQWVVLLVKAINEHFQTRDVNKAKKSIAYLQQKIEDTSISEMQAVFYGMIETQTQTLMLAEVDEHYLLVDVVPPKVAELRSSPKRPLIVLMFTFFGGLFVTGSTLLRGMLKSSKTG